jgi:hypothetical protein
MKIPFRPSLLTIRRQTIKWLIVHHTVEFYELPEARIDNSKYQTKAIFKGVLERKEPDVNYNVIIEKVDEDYIPIVTRPFAYLCDFPDIHADVNKRALHVALLGSYDFKIPNIRLLEVLAYRVLNPFMNIFKIPTNKVKLHREVSTDKDITCPGDFVDSGKIISLIKRYVIK